MLILPAIDIMGGKCVRLAQGNFDAATTYGDPVEQCAAFEDAGAEWIHVVDLDGAREGKPMQHDLLRRLTQNTRCKIQFGGGVRDLAQIEALIDSGVSRVVLGSLALERSSDVRDWIASFGAERICCAFDVRPLSLAYEIVVRGWSARGGVGLDAALARFPPGSLKHVLVTDISRDGVLTGPNIALMSALKVLRPDLNFQASGGVSSLDDLKALHRTGVSAAIVGRALYERRLALEDALAV